jgi:PAS domain S-box-containing protein
MAAPVGGPLRKDAMEPHPMDSSALDAAPIPTLVLRARRFVYANDAVVRLLHTTRGELLGRLYTDFVAPDDLERVADHQARRLRGESSPETYVTTLLRGTERRSVRVHAAATTSGEIVVQFIDIALDADRSIQETARLYEDLRRSYAELARAQDQLVRQERLAALGELAAVVAHEVRNPLGAIFNSLGTLRRLVRPSGDAKMLLDIVAEEADRLNRIVSELLDFARPSPPALRPQPLERVLDEAVAAALAGTDDRIALVRDVPDALPLIPMDARLIRQAILNVALNAVQAMSEGGTLTVRARLAGDTAVVELADTGPGIPSELRCRIFEPFFTTKATGTGLGLAVLKRILDDHRGRVEVRGGEQRGTVFALHLPLGCAPVENGRR